MDGARCSFCLASPSRAKARQREARNSMVSRDSGDEAVSARRSHASARATHGGLRLAGLAVEDSEEQARIRAWSETILRAWAVRSVRRRTAHRGRRTETQGVPPTNRITNANHVRMGGYRRTLVITATPPRKSPSSEFLQLPPRRAMLAFVGHPSEEARMIRLIAAVLLVLTAAVPAVACEWNQSAANTQSKTTASQAATAHDSRS